MLLIAELHYLHFLTVRAVATHPQLAASCAYFDSVRLKMEVLDRIFLSH